MTMVERLDFWVASGHHLVDRDPGGGLLVTDAFLQAYLARPELIPPRKPVRLSAAFMPACWRRHGTRWHLMNWP